MDQAALSMRSRELPAAGGLSSSMAWTPTGNAEPEAAATART